MGRKNRKVNEWNGMEWINNTQLTLLKLLIQQVSLGDYYQFLVDISQ
jgi:hypothetical protein